VENLRKTTGRPTDESMTREWLSSNIEFSMGGSGTILTPPIFFQGRQRCDSFGGLVQAN